MNAKRVAQLLRELADELERPDSEAPREESPPPRPSGKITRLDRQAVRELCAKKGIQLPK